MRAFALALPFFSLAAAAFAEDIYKLKKTAKAHKELRVQGYANFKDSCESKELPEIDLSIPPTGGTVCARPGMVQLQELWSDRNRPCLGKRVSGVFVIYFPFGSFTGLDTMQYTVRGVQTSRTYAAEITVEAGQATAAGASSPSLELQKAGPMPACPALVSQR